MKSLFMITALGAAGILALAASPRHSPAAEATYSYDILYNYPYNNYFWGDYYSDDIYEGYGWTYWDEPLTAGEGEVGSYGHVDDFQVDNSRRDIYDAYTPYEYGRAWWINDWDLRDYRSWMKDEDYYEGKVGYRTFDSTDN